MRKGIESGPLRAVISLLTKPGHTVTLAEGASLDDDTIRQIRSDRVVLTGPKGEVILHLTYDKSRPTGLLTTIVPF